MQLHRSYLPLLILLAGTLAGCSKLKPPTLKACNDSDHAPCITVVCPQGTPDCAPIIIEGMKQAIAPSHEAAVYAELWRVCKEKKLKFFVRCNPDCHAEAWNSDYDWMATQDGTIQFWRAVPFFNGGPTRAAEELLDLLKKPPNASWPKAFDTGFDTGEVRP